MMEIDNQSKPGKKASKQIKKIAKHLLSKQAQHKYTQSDQTQIIVKKPCMSEPLEFPRIQKTVLDLATQIVEAKISRRRAILLAKLQRQDLIRSLHQNLQPGSTDLIKRLPPPEDSLILKSFHQINQHFTNQLSVQLTQTLSYFLKESKISAKVISNVVIVENPGSGFNMGGICYWNSNEDGVTSIKRFIEPIVSGSKENRLQPLSKECTLAANIYLCRYEEKFKGLSFNQSYC